MVTRPRKKPHSMKPVSPVELARREWCRRNFLLAGIKKNLELISTELNLAPNHYDPDTLIGLNNSDGRSKGLNIT